MTLPLHFLVLLVCTSSLACAPKPATPDGDSKPVTETPATPDGDSQPVTETPETPETPATYDTSDMFACASDDHCVVLEMGCCDHCNGGWQLSVNTAHAEAATAKHHDQNCTGGCTKRGCAWKTTAVCHEGTCAMSEDRNLSGTATIYENELR